MNQSSHKLQNVGISILLILIFVLVITDLSIDFQQGQQWKHLSIELTIAIVAATGSLLLLKDVFKTKRKLEIALQQNRQLKLEAEKWKEESSKFIEGLGKAIDLQFQRWSLSPAEKEVALLLLKGLSLKEIAQIRNTAEKTVRAQSTAIYQKSGLEGRSDLAAFFLEDLLLPTSLSSP